MAPVEQPVFVCLFLILFLFLIVFNNNSVVVVCVWPKQFSEFCLFVVCFHFPHTRAVSHETERTRPEGKVPSRLFKSSFFFFFFLLMCLVGKLGDVYQ